MTLSETSDKKKWLVFLLVAVAVFMSTLDSSIVNVALPAIMEDFQVSLRQIEWVVVIYLLTVSSLLLPFGRLSDIKGRRWVYCRGFCVFSAGSFLCGVADSALWLIAARAFQGIGAAMLMACSPALVVDIFPSSERGKALGIVGTVVAAGLTAGPALGGFLIKTFSWSAIFYVNIPIGIVAGATGYFLLKGGQGDISRNENFDWPGAVLLTVTLFGFFLAFIKASDWGFTSSPTIIMAGVAILSGTLLIFKELQSENPVFDPSLLKVRQFALPVISAMILFASLFTIVFLMPFYLVNPRGFSIDQAGYTMAMPFFCLFFLSPLSGSLSDRIGTRFLCTLGMAILTMSLFLMSQLSASASFFSISWRLVLVGVGTAIFLPPNSSIVLSALPANRRGVASGTVATARNVGMVIGVAQASLIFNKVFSLKSGGEIFKVYVQEIEPFFMASFKHAMLAGALVSGIGVILTFFRGPDKPK
ncbi:MAG: DHA2 family efflux MFS transporter permease subunit [Desulfobacterales bacterium]